MRSEELYAKTSRLTPAGVSSPVRAFKPYPLFFREGHGCRFTDVDGEEYVDLCMAYGPLVSGHGCPEIMAAARDQLAKGTVYGAPSEPELGLLERIHECVPSAEMVRLACSGTEATMHAIRTARGFTGKDGIVKMNGGFHGAHDSVLVGAGSGSAGGVPSSKGVLTDTAKHTFTAEYNDLDSMASILEKDDIACVIMEPVMGNVGVVPPEKGYLEEVRKLTRETGTVLIFDEVITGFRLGPGGAQEMFGVTPDMTTLAKIIGGGFPAGAFAGRADIMGSVAPLGPVYAAGTFAGNPVSAAAGCAQIDYMLSDNRYGRLNETSGRLVSAMRDLLADSGAEGCINSVGSMFSVFFGRDRVTNGTEAMGVDRKAFDSMFRFMLKRGIYMPPSALEVEFLSTAHDERSVALISEAFGDFLREFGA